MLARKMLGMVGDMHLKVREELLCGRYDWFKPIYATNIEASMIKANKELQEVIDNGHLVRGHASKKYMKEGKIFTFQGNEPLTYWTEEHECVHEDIDNKGRPYVEYIYNSKEETPKIEQWVKCSEEKFRTFTREDCDLYVNAPNLQIRNNFHLFFFGLDKVNLTIKELYQEILIKMQTLVGNVDIKNIMILDNESLLGRVWSRSGHDGERQAEEEHQSHGEPGEARPHRLRAVRQRAGRHGDHHEQSQREPPAEQRPERRAVHRALQEPAQFHRGPGPRPQPAFPKRGPRLLRAQQADRERDQRDKELPDGRQREGPAEEERRAQRRREASLCQTSVEQELSNYESPNFFQERIQLKRE